MTNGINLQEKSRLTIESSLSECESHYKILDKRKKTLDVFFPLTRDLFEKLTDGQIEHIDQFIYRFTKLQDSFGSRMLPSIYYYLENETKAVPFLDIISRLEKLEIVPSEDDWQYFRNLRNNLTHDYPESVEQTIFTLNSLYSGWDKIVSLYTCVRKHARKIVLK